MFYKILMPNNWKDLQNEVSEYLGELGFSTYTPYMCTNESISFEIDVYAEKQLNGIPLKILIECKQWNTEVPQDVVFSMITRVNKFGANLGLIISKKGFQKGAILAVKNTNILLYTFDDFLTHFKDEWLDMRLNRAFKRLSIFNEVRWDCFLDREEAKGGESEFLNKYGYLYIIFSNMRSGYCISHENYSDEGFFNHFPAIVIFPLGKKYKVDVLGDAFRLLLKTDYIEQIEVLSKGN